jgi:hypothetical protein
VSRVVQGSRGLCKGQGDSAMGGASVKGLVHGVVQVSRGWCNGWCKGQGARVKGWCKGQGVGASGGTRVNDSEKL